MLRVNPLSNLGQSAQVVGTTNINNATDAWADMADMSINITTKGGDVLLMYSSTIRVNQDSQASLRFDVDGAPHPPSNGLHVRNPYPGSMYRACALQWVEIGLAAGAHTFKVQWYDVAGDIAQDGVSYPRVFTAIELPS